VDRPWDWTGWTVGIVRKGVALIAAQAQFPADKLLARMVVSHREAVVEKAPKVRELTRKAQALRRRVKAAEDRERLRRLLPEPVTLDKVLRYEAHVSRQLLQTLHTLERLQAARAGAAVPVPAALDVTVNGPMQALEKGMGEGGRS
jgi:hypothetical protein